MKFSKFFRPLVHAAILFSFLIGGLSAQEAQKISVLLVTGANNHDWPYTSKHMAAVLTKTGRFQVTTTTDPKTFLAKEDLSPFQVVYLDYNGPSWGEVANKKFMAAVEKGLGVCVVHAANNAFVGWKDYETMSVFCWRKGTGHGKFHVFDVDVIDRNHPITRDFPPMKAHPDELYHRLVHMHGAKYNLLMAAQSSKESGGSGRTEPMVVTTRVGKGRIFHTPLGHVWPEQPSTRASLADPQLQFLLARGTEWAATGDCTLKAIEFGIRPYIGTKAKRPTETWVRRCVLDGKARMIVISLDDCLTIAFDAATCQIYRAWGGILALQGTVYDGVHGPQPKAIGIPYSTEIKNLTSSDRRKYLGYRIQNNQITLLYRPVGREEVLIEETIEHGALRQAALRRDFVISGLKHAEKIRFHAGPRTKDFAVQITSRTDNVWGTFKSPDADGFTELGNGRHLIRRLYKMTGEEK